jgi:hypothetical protein
MSSLDRWIVGFLLYADAAKTIDYQSFDSIRLFAR